MQIPFRPPAGPKVRRWMGICADGWPFVLAGCLFTYGWARWVSPAGAFIPAVLTLFLAWFFRDPRRTAPADPNALVSPADGKILGVRRAAYPRLLAGEATRVSIFMSPLDVHVNRVPCAGTVRAVHYHPGKFLAAFAEKASLDNEQSATLFDTDRGPSILFVQIAGILARRIVNRLRSGEHLERGERFGLIRFGSRMDVYLPKEVEPAVAAGDAVKAGQSVLGFFR